MIEQVVTMVNPLMRTALVPEGYCNLSASAFSNVVSNEMLVPARITS